jgi:hypothetical protein
MHAKIESYCDKARALANKKRRKNKKQFYKPGSVPKTSFGFCHLSGDGFATKRNQPTHYLVTHCVTWTNRPQKITYLAFQRMRFVRKDCHQALPSALTRHFHPYQVALKLQGGYFL